MEKQVFEYIEKQIKEKGFYKIDGFGIWEKLPRKKGKAFCGFQNKEGKPIYKTRIKFTSDKKLKDRLCK